MENKELIDIANKAKNFSYSPYSKFRVGAALLCEDGKIFTGCNIENASYGLAVCAERTAMLKAISEGYKNFKKIAIVVDTPTPAYPCGACMQVMSEFAPNLQILLCGSNNQIVETNLTQIFPQQFSL